MKLYTRTVCPKCLWIKSEIERSGAKVTIVNIDHDEEARERLIQYGIKGVPVMEVEGTHIVDPIEMVRRMEELG